MDGRAGSISVDRGGLHCNHPGDGLWCRWLFPTCPRRPLALRTQHQHLLSRFKTFEVFVDSPIASPRQVRALVRRVGRHVLQLLQLLLHLSIS